MSIDECENIKMENPPVIVTGVTGQDGSYMVEFLLKHTDYHIFGGARRLSVANHDNLKHLENNPRFNLINFDLTDYHSIYNLIYKLKPSYFINFAAQSFVKSSWDFPKQTWDVNTTGVLNILEAIRIHSPTCRFYNAGCHSADTKVLTPSGFKKYTEMGVGDIVYTINPKTKNLEFKKIKRVFEYDYTGYLYEFKNGGLLVTPNHKMFYTTKQNKIKVVEAKQFIKLLNAEYPVNKPYKGRMLDDKISLSKYIDFNNNINNTTNINSYDLMYIIGLYVGNHLSKCVVQNNNIKFIFTLPKNKKILTKITTILNQNNINWKFKGKYNIIIDHPKLDPYLLQCEISNNLKRIPQYIFDLDSSYQLKVLEGIKDSNKHGVDKLLLASTQLQFDLVKLHIHCGIMPSFGTQSVKRLSLKETPKWISKSVDNTYEKDNYGVVYYIGKVWCFEVEDNHNFIVERNGKLTFSGNSSEEFGDVVFSPLTEEHPSRPRSPYGASKAAARQLVKVYRDSYNLYAVQGWLFNHECLTENTPILIKYIDSDTIDIKPIEELVPYGNDTFTGKYTTTTIPNFLVWDGNKWSRILTRTATWNDSTNDKKVKGIGCLGGYYEATADHISFLENETQINTERIVVGDKLELKSLPNIESSKILTDEESEFLGIMVSYGCIEALNANIVTKCKNLVDKVNQLWNKLSIGYTSIFSIKNGNSDEYTYNIQLLGDNEYINYIKGEIYTQNKHKRIPAKILNSNTSLIISFLKGYNYTENSEFKCFVTNSQIVAAGLWLISEKILNIKPILNIKYSKNIKYFEINLNSENYFIDFINKVTTKTDIDYTGWLFDLETESGTFSAGIGLTWVHNSPRRGEEFVTRKITKAVAKIKNELINGNTPTPIELGNLDVIRDWSYANDMIHAIWRMLNQDIYNENIKSQIDVTKNSIENTKQLSKLIKEYVAASGECHTVREFVELAFKYVNINGEWIKSDNPLSEIYVLKDSSLTNNVPYTLVKINPIYFRPSEVDLLLGDPSRIKNELGWVPKMKFETLVEKMVITDLK